MPPWTHLQPIDRSVRHVDRDTHLSTVGASATAPSNPLTNGLFLAFQHGQAQRTDATDAQSQPTLAALMVDTCSEAL